MMTYRSNPFDKQDYSKFAFKKSELLEVLQAIDSSFNFDSGLVTKQEYKEVKNIQSDTNANFDYRFFLFKKPLLTFHEAACIMTGYDPQYVEQCQNDTNFKQNFSNYLGACDYISTCVDVQMLSYDSYSNRLYTSEFKQFLANENTFINGFNDELRHSEVSHLDQNSADDNSTIEQLKKENEELKVELLGKERRIKELESIQTSIEDESKLGRTRAENNAAKLILALSELASIDISKPYAPYESLKTQGELLGIDKFPSNENVATWLKRANAQKS
jgi:hypothetical protein